MKSCFIKGYSSLSLVVLLASSCVFGEEVSNVALGKVATASGNENGQFLPSLAVDGIINRDVQTMKQSRWASDLKSNNFENDSWVSPNSKSNIWYQVDLGKVTKNLTQLVIDWEHAKGAVCSVMMSNDGINWREVHNFTSTGRRDDITLPTVESARFVKIEIKKFAKGNWAAVSIYEFSVYNGKCPITLDMAASSFTVENNLDLSGKIIKYKNLPKGVKAKIVGTTYEQVINFNGLITKPLSDMTSKVTFELSDGVTSVATTTFDITIKGTAKAGGNIKPMVIPALQEWQGGNGVFKPTQKTRIVVRTADAKLGSPSLFERMQVFAADYKSQTGQAIEVTTAKKAKDGDIFVSLNSSDKSLGKEGYKLNVDKKIEILAIDPLGAFWATRSILQVLMLNDNSFPCGVARDYPQYAVRGFLYDVGRKPTTLESLYFVMKTMSWYKLNDLQVHLNDNFIWLHEYTQAPSTKDATAEQKKLAAQQALAAAPTAFRLESDMVGKNGVKLTASDYSYTKKQFGTLIDNSRAYGVNIVPEIDIPGHAMSFVSVRPDLMYRGKVHKGHDVERAAMLDVSNDIYDAKTGRTYREESLAFIQSVFDEYLDGSLPVFRDSVVHIGTDEYYGGSEDYRAFADEMLKYVKSKGRTPRLWGSLTAKAGKTPVISDGVQMNIWSLGWQRPESAISAGFDIINILDVDTYVVPNGTGNVGGYGDYVNLGFLYGKNWQPNIMRQNKIIAGHPKMLGAQWAVWNDNTFRRDTGLTDYDLFERIQKTCSVLAEKTWNVGSDSNFEDFMAYSKKLADAPGVNAMHKAKDKNGIVMEMEFENSSFVDLTGNGHNGIKHHNITFSEGKSGKGLKLNGASSYVQTSLANLAPNYKVEFWVKRLSSSTQEQILFSSYTGEFKAVQKETGKVGFTRDSWDFSFDYTLPVNEWVKLTLVGENRKSTLYVNDKEIGSPIRHNFPQSFKFGTFIMPLEFIGSKENAFSGLIDCLKVTK